MDEKNKLALAVEQTGEKEVGTFRLNAVIETSRAAAAVETAPSIPVH